MYLGTSEKYVPRKSKREMLESVETYNPGFIVLSSKMTARNTMEYRVRYDDGSESIRVRFHSTDIFEVRYSGLGKDKPSKIRLNSGGWKTTTTKDRINAAIATYLPKVKHKSNFGDETFMGVPFQVHSERGKWFTAPGVLFVDDAWLKPDGTPCKPSLHRQTGKQQATDEKLIDAYIAKLKKDGIPAGKESGGDPFAWPDPKTGKYSADLIRDWLKDQYVFLAMVTSAVTWRGVGSSGPLFYLGITTGLTYEKRGKVDARTAQIVRRYLRACLGYAV
jgi:hypothetical protein